MAQGLQHRCNPSFCAADPVTRSRNWTPRKTERPQHVTVLRVRKDPITLLSLAMSHTLPIGERAFQLARSGKYSSLDDIKTQLKAEGYNRDHLYGRTLAKQELCLNLGDSADQAAACFWLASMPSVNLIPSMSFGNWFWHVPFSRRWAGMVFRPSPLAHLRPAPTIAKMAVPWQKRPNRFSKIWWLNEPCPAPLSNDRKEGAPLSKFAEYSPRNAHPKLCGEKGSTMPSLKRFSEQA